MFCSRTPHQLFLNQGNGKFKAWTVESGLRAHPGNRRGGPPIRIRVAPDYDILYLNLARLYGERVIGIEPNKCCKPC